MLFQANILKKQATVMLEKILELIENVIPHEILPVKDEILVNPTGRFVVGGPDGDAGLTGRKIIVDTYGGAAPRRWSIFW